MGNRYRWAVLAATALAGCAVLGLQGLEPGRSTQAEVRQALGEPALAIDGAGGSRQLVFPRGPAGTETYMAFIDRDGRLVRLEQALTEDRFRQLAVGRSSGDDVLRLIGPPWRRIDFANKGQVAWDYRFRDPWGYLAEFSVMLDAQGVVADTVTVRLERDRSDAIR